MVETEIPKTRRRAVRLTPQGLLLLKEALEKAEREQGLSGASREERARLLDVSVVTAGRILKREGVDRASLKAAFESLGLEWRDSLCEFLVEKRPVVAYRPETAADRRVRRKGMTTSPFRPCSKTLDSLRRPKGS